MSLSLLALLLCTPPAQAQYPGGYPGSGPAQDPGHRWNITYANSNVVNKHFQRDVPTPGQITPTNSAGGSTIVDGDEEVTVTATLTWVPAAGKDNTSDPPPDKDHKVHLIESGYAWECSLWGGSGSAPSGAGTADDGLGDAPVPDYNGLKSQGNHLIQRDGSSGTITLDPVTVKAINPVSTYQSGYPGGGGSYPGGGGGYPGGGGYGYWDWTGGEDSVSFTVAVDPDVNPRLVTITSSIDPTYHKGSAITDNGSPQPMPDVPDARGTINANTLKPTSHSLFASDGVSPDITYYAHPAGSWAADSSYLWHIVEGDGLTNPPSGTFTMPGDPPYSEGTGYYLDSIAGGPEHVYIHLTDAADGANATANYYVNWHDPVEKWHPNGSSFPMPPTCYGDSKVSQPAGGQDTVEIDVPPGKVSATAGDKTLGGVITTAAAVVAVVAPETDPVIIGLMTAAGYTLSVEPDPADQSYKIPGPKSQFEADVATQVAINNGNTSGVFRPDLPRMDRDLANAISQSGDYDGYFSGKYGTMSFGVQIFQLQWSQNYLGDAYGASGYTGDASGVVSWPGSIPPADYVFNWTKV